MWLLVVPSTNYRLSLFALHSIHNPRPGPHPVAISLLLFTMTVRYLKEVGVPLLGCAESIRGSCTHESSVRTALLQGNHHGWFCTHAGEMEAFIRRVSVYLYPYNTIWVSAVHQSTGAIHSHMPLA
jgi:hypothetical protein